MAILETRTIWVLIVAFIVFATVPQIIHYGANPGEFQSVVYKYLDFDFFVNTYEYSVQDVNMTESNLQRVTIHTNSKYDIQGVIYGQLFLLIDEENDKLVYTSEDIIIISSLENATTDFEIELPTDLESGNYSWLSFVTLEVAEEVYKTKTIRSNKFKIVR